MQTPIPSILHTVKPKTYTTAIWAISINPVLLYNVITYLIKLQDNINLSFTCMEKIKLHVTHFTAIFTLFWWRQTQHAKSESYMNQTHFLHPSEHWPQILSQFLLFLSFLSSSFLPDHTWLCLGLSPACMLRDYWHVSGDNVDQTYLTACRASSLPIVQRLQHHFSSYISIQT